MNLENTMYLTFPCTTLNSQDVLRQNNCTSDCCRRSHKQGVDLALSLSLDPHDSEAPSLDLIAKDAPTLLAWADGLNMLLGESVSAG